MSILSEQSVDQSGPKTPKGPSHHIKAKEAVACSSIDKAADTSTVDKASADSKTTAHEPVVNESVANEPVANERESSETTSEQLYLEGNKTTQVSVKTGTHKDIGIETVRSHQLQALCLDPILQQGDLAAAAALITQSVSDIFDVARVSFWLYSPEDSSQKLTLVDSFDRELNLHKSGLVLLLPDFAPYFETLGSRSGLRIESADDVALPVSCLAQANIIFHEPGALLEVPIHYQGDLAGVIWCERPSAYRWSALENAMATSVALLASTAFGNHWQQKISSELQAHRQQLKRETIEREQAEQAWQESQRFIQGIIDASTNILYVDSFADGSNFYINRWVENVLGYSSYDVQKLGDRYLEKLIHADDKATMIKERRKLLASNDGEVIENEYRFRHRQGNWRWLLCRETVFQRDKDGQPTQVFGTATDITKHKLAEVALQEFNEELARLARMDGLTQVANRRSFDEYLAQEWENVGSGRSSLSLILCDIDYFKSFNDTYGHQAGDVCLRQVAQAIEHAVKRNTDLVARYGGEEFAIILPNTNEVGVHQVAKEIQKEIQQLNILHSQSEVSDYITLSLGIASISRTENANPDMLIASADQGLYQAKYDGRNRSCVGEIEYPQSSL